MFFDIMQNKTNNNNVFDTVNKSNYQTVQWHNQKKIAERIFQNKKNNFQFATKIRIQKEKEN